MSASQEPALLHYPGGLMHYLVGRSSTVVWTVCLFVVSSFYARFRACRRARLVARHSKRSTRCDRRRRQVELLNGTTVVKTTTTDGLVTMRLMFLENARYSGRAIAPTFQSTTSDSVYVTKSTKAELDVTLATQTLTQQVSVTASATPTPIAQIGASVTVLTATTIVSTPKCRTHCARSLGCR